MRCALHVALLASLTLLVSAVAIAAADNPVLANGKITVTLDPARRYLPGSIRTADGIEVCKAKETGFQVYVRVREKNGSTPKICESREGRGGFFGKTQHRQTERESVTTTRGGTCSVTRTITLPEDQARLDVSYRMEAIKPFTIGYGSWIGGLFLSLPQFALSPAFDKSFTITFPDQKLTATPKDEAPKANPRPPYWKPIFAASSKHDAVVMIVPTLIENCDLFLSGAAAIETTNPRFAEWGANAIRTGVGSGVLPKTKLDEALALTSTRIKLTPKDAMLRAAHARVLAALGQYADAAKNIQTALTDVRGTKQDEKWRIDMWKRHLKEYNGKANK